MSLSESNMLLRSLPRELLRIIGHHIRPEHEIKSFNDFKTYEAAISSLKTLASESGIDNLLEREVQWLEGQSQYWKALEKVRFWTCLPDGIEAVQEEFFKDTPVETIASLMRPWIQEKLAGLKELDLSGNCLPFLPNEVAELKDLEKLNLSRCMLENLTEKISELENLKELDVTHNKLIEIPKVLRDKRGLTIIEDEAPPERVFQFNPPKR